MLYAGPEQAGEGQRCISVHVQLEVLVSEGTEGGLAVACSPQERPWKEEGPGPGRAPGLFVEWLSSLVPQACLLVSSHQNQSVYHQLSKRAQHHGLHLAVTTMLR